MDTPRSNFVRALDHFWNSWATSRKDIVLIICGSATSWIINNVIMNYGGLHNRLTGQICLEPFCLSECKAYCQRESLPFTDRQIMELYMALGGIPYYWSFLQRGLSLAQNFDQIFFAERGALSHEFDALYASLFRKPRKHIALITALTGKKMGMTRTELLRATRMQDNTDFSAALKELEQCGFIRRYTSIEKKVKSTIYQLIDNYTLFYFDFIKKNVNGDEHFWSSQAGSALHHSWAGRAFERLCIQHLPQIKASLGFSAVISSAHAWTFKPSAQQQETGAQIDLLIDRNDDTINLCEMKYASAPYTLSKEEDMRLRHRKETFIRESKTHKAVLLTLITPFGLTRGGYADDIPCEVTMEGLFG